MKKNRNQNAPGYWGILQGLTFKKTLKMLRFVSFCFFISLTNVMAIDSYSQMTRLSLKVENDRLENVLRTIEDKTEYFFLYNRDLVNVDQKVRINVQDRTIMEILDNLLKGTDISYEITNRQIVLSSNQVLAYLATQQKTVTGTVTDEQGNGLPGVSIAIKGKSQGTITDPDGRFRISAAPDDILVFSFIGFKTKELAVGGSEVMNVVLAAEVHELDELVVTALGISRQSKALPYNTQTIESTELTAIRDPNNVMNALQGKVANSLITQGSGGVGDDARIVLRGNSSIAGNNNALVVVDGVPNSRGVNINPDDIETLTVLNGSAAAALYGSAAGNGVLVITTKKGGKEKASVSVNSGMTFNNPFSLPKFQDQYGQGMNGNLDANNGNNWGPEMNGQEYTNMQGEKRKYSPQPDNVRDFFDRAILLNNTISVQAGGEKAQGYLSYTNTKNDGIVPGNSLLSHNVNLRLTTAITPKFSTDAKITYYTGSVKGILRAGEGNTSVLDIYQIPRNMALSDVKKFETPDAFGVPKPAPFPSTLASRYQNPYWIVNYDRTDDKRSQIYGFVSLKYEFTKWLSLKARANMDKYSVVSERRTNQGTVDWATRPGGYYSISHSNSLSQWYDVTLDGSNDLGESFKLDYHIGGIFQDGKYEQTAVTANGLNVANKFSINFATTPVPTSSSTHVQTQSLFGLANLSYKGMFYFDASLRNDWDSRLPSPHAYQYFSLGGAAILSEIVEMPASISFFKISGSYAEVGNGGQFGLLENTFSYSAGTANGYIARSQTYSIPGLKPEIVKSKEFGVEIKFLKNRLSLNGTYYHSNSMNQLLTIAMPVATGFSRQYINAGNIQNKGVEIILSGQPIAKKDFNWTVDYNVAFNKNKVIELSEGLNVVYQGSFADWGGRPQVAVGGSFGDIVATKWARNDKGQFLVTDNGLPIASGKVGQQPSLIGNFNPDATMGLTNTVQYKDFSFRVLMDGRIGAVAIFGTEMNLSYSGLTESTLPYREGGWVLGGVNTSGQLVNAAISSQQFWQTVSGKRHGTGEFYAYDATNFRVREISIGYSLPVPNYFFIKSAEISLVARNLFWLYRGKSKLDIPGLDKRTMWFDPDITYGTGNTFKGIEYGMPSTRSIGVNLHLNF